MESVLRDVRFAVRRLRKSPGFTAIALLSLALGIGANTAIFSLVDAIILRQPPIPEPERVLDVSSTSPDLAFLPLSYPEYVDLRERTRGTFSQISYSWVNMVPQDLGGRVETVPIEMVNGDYFPLLGLAPRLGRLLGPGDDVPGGVSPVVVVSYDYWRATLGGATNVVGREVRLAGRRYTIVGVAPASYSGTIRGIAPAYFAPIRLINALLPTPQDLLRGRDAHSGFVKARLTRGVTLARARGVAAGIDRMEQQTYPDQWSGSRSLRLVPLTEVAVNPVMDRVVVPAARLLMLLVGLVLLIACANLASFLLAQARDRRRELAVRLALGASGAALARQLLTEALALAALGGLAGLLLARAGIAALLRAPLPLAFPIRLDVPLDGRVLAFAVVASLGAGILFGLAPALEARRTAPAATMRSETAGGGPGRRFTLRNALVVGQVAVSLVLLIAAGLFVRSLLAQRATDPGWGHGPMVLVTILLPADRYPGTRAAAFIDRAEAELRALPGVEAVGITGYAPLDFINSSQTNVNLPGITPPKGEPGFSVDYSPVDTGFFAAARISIVRGRNFGPSDVAGAPRVAIINDAMARRFWPDSDPIGRTFRTDSGIVHVVGVTRDFKVRSLGEAPRPYLFVPATQEAAFAPTLVIRSRLDAEPLVSRTLAVLRSLDRDLPIFRALSGRRYLASVVLPAQLAAAAVGAFALLALLLATIGIWGVVRYAVARRTREVAIRISIGASHDSVVRLLMRDGITLVLAGTAIGLALGFALAQAMRSLLFGVPAIDPVTFFAVPLLFLTVGSLAALLPALRVTRVAPALAIRTE